MLKIKKTLVYSFIIFLLFLQSCALLLPSPNKMYKKAMLDQPYDAIIVPGVPYSDEKWSDVMKIRVYWAQYLYSKGIAKNVIFSGSAVYTPYIEGKIMAMYGEAIGIPKEHIFVEPTAEHSTENLYYSYQLGKKQGFKKIALASDPYQGSFLYKFAKKKNIPVATIPINFDTLGKINKIDPVIDAKKAYVANFQSIVDRENFFERLRGTRGKNIKYEQD